MSDSAFDEAGKSQFVPAPCQVACPIGTDAPSYIAHIWEGKYAAAFEAITATNPFSSICGRVCDAPCEPACRRASSDGPIAIRNLKRFVMDKLGRDHHSPPVPVSRTKTVGIVGSGPAGLTAARDLAEAGYAVHVYEMTDRLGGMMVWGIPAFRLPPGIIAEDLDRMMAHCPGIEVHLNRALGRDLSLETLRERHDAVLLAIGAWWGKPMGIPGEDDSRVVDGVGFLREVNGGARPTLPETVVVVGGGDVAMDACRVAIRLPGCKRVTVVYRRGAEDIPARRDELEGARAEGIELITHTQQTAVVANGNRLALRCLRAQAGAAEADGRRQPVPVAGSEHDIACGMVIAAVGQRAGSDELESRDLMNIDRVRADFNTMATPIDGVFAAGDGAFGGSTIVMAMHHGHKAAYYVRAFLEGRPTPAPYRTPFRTRRVAVAPDPKWELFPRQHQAFHGLGEDPASFPEIESTYAGQAARDEAARCYRCDAETGSADFSVRNREDIFAMARLAGDDGARQTRMLRRRLKPRDPPFARDRAATLDDIVFLPANLSRLVIDPYREACATRTRLGPRLVLANPLLATGFDEAEAPVRDALFAGLAESGSGYVGARAPGRDVAWLRLAPNAQDAPAPEAGAVIYPLGSEFRPLAATRASPEQALGLSVARPALEAAIPFALDNGFELLLLDGSAGLGHGAAEQAGFPDLAVIRDAVAILRRLRKEGALDLIYFGGVRSGTDIAKVIALGCRAAMVGTALGLALGGTLDQAGAVTFPTDRDGAERRDAAANFITACAGETSMMARCTGKTDIHNLEPEDLRAISLATARAAGIPLAGTL
ncbi:MAG: FAD-dependent oxidoreductase [Alphaproteobacteria bacterium]|jgi:NADPH-dependent glutamate synthase beta subunit-like oxidoreductase|nr:FAD-dependent oxidoreductase [Alphaproteobacteria bacterium]MDP6515034.1 FAD-dependent oxidoreductase [Alphaproteobacteria bacterium]